MTDAPVRTSGTEDVAKAMRLRADPPKVMRLSRKALLIGGCVIAVAGSAVLAFALRTPARPTPPQELYRPAATPSETVAALPKDYTGPRLGPPLPGDLGRPILAAGQENDWSGEKGPAVSSASAQAESEADRDARQRRDRAIEAQEAALRSGLFSNFASASQAGPAPPVDDDTAAPEGPTGPQTDAQTAADLWPGVIISGALITGLRSDLPGPVLGQVTEDVRDSASGLNIVIPRGSRLIGAYDAEVAYGQSRLRILWKTLVTPTGRTVALDDLQASDPSGYAGLEDRVDNRWGERLRAAGLTTLLSISTAVTEGDDEDRIVRALRDGAGRSVDQVGRQVTERSLSVPPRLTVRPGSPFHIILTEGLSLPSQGD